MVVSGGYQPGGREVGRGGSWGDVGGGVGGRDGGAGGVGGNGNRDGILTRMRIHSS